jgi:hypothetical protein
MKHFWLTRWCEMNAEIFAEWLRRQGHLVVRTQSTYWYDASPRVYQAFPYHWLIRPSEGELLAFLRKDRAIGLRYSAPADEPQGRISYHVVYEAPQYNLELLERRARQNVRNGLSRCTVQPIALERLADEGWLLETDTVDRQDRHVRMTREIWRRRYLSASDLPGFEAWGALIEDRLVASILTFRMDDCCELISQQCHREFLNARVNNALAFTVTQAMVSRPGIRSIFYTLQSLDAPPSVDEFKFRMGYKAKQVRQRVVFHPMLAPLIRPALGAAVKELVRRFPGVPSLPKAVGMLQFYLEGRRPLKEQHWPECLTKCDEAAGVRG